MKIFLSSLSYSYSSVLRSYSEYHGSNPNSIIPSKPHIRCLPCIYLLQFHQLDRRSIPFTPRLVMVDCESRSLPSMTNRIHADRTRGRHSSGYSVSISSRLVPKSHFVSREAVTSLVDALQEGQKILLDGDPTNVDFRILFGSPSKPGTFDTPSPDTSVTPVWYESFWHVMYSGSFRSSSLMDGRLGSHSVSNFLSLV